MLTRHQKVCLEGDWQQLLETYERIRRTLEQHTPDYDLNNLRTYVLPSIENGLGYDGGDFSTNGHLNLHEAVERLLEEEEYEMPDQDYSLEDKLIEEEENEQT